jgi:hypothetical protein
MCNVRVTNDIQKYITCLIFSLENRLALLIVWVDLRTVVKLENPIDQEKPNFSLPTLRSLTTTKHRSAHTSTSGFYLPVKQKWPNSNEQENR